MLNLDDYKKSRVYKETWEESREARDAEWIDKLSEQGFSAEKIAPTMGLDLDVVKKILKKKPKRKS